MEGSVSSLQAHEPLQRGEKIGWKHREPCRDFRGSVNVLVQQVTVPVPPSLCLYDLQLMGSNVCLPRSASQNSLL